MATRFQKLKDQIQDLNRELQRLSRCVGERPAAPGVEAEPTGDEPSLGRMFLDIEWD